MDELTTKIVAVIKQLDGHIDDLIEIHETSSDPEVAVAANLYARQLISLREAIK